MKNIVAALLFVSSAVFAQQVEIVRDTDDGNVWYGYPETFLTVDAKHVMLVEIIGKDGSGKLYISVNDNDCRKDTAVLYGRRTPKQRWTELDVASISAPATVSAILVKTLCTVGEYKKSKTSLKST